jgi:type IV pilus assembly protein PilP
VIHRVTVGNYMGQNFGKITNISESEVSLDEIVPDGFGGFKEQPASLAAEQK